MERRPYYHSLSRFALAVFFIIYALYAVVSGAINGGNVWVILETVSAAVAGVALAVGY